MPAQHTFDKSALTFNQLSIVTLTTFGFILNQPLIPAFVAAVLIGGSLTPALAVFKLIYKHAVKPLGLMKPEIVQESSTPHEFAQLLGGCFLGAGAAALLLGSATIGWALAWLVIFLALANLVFGFCAGCFVYFQLGKFGVPGFSSTPNNVSAQR